MYHEALKSNSDFYKFLCYYKVLEGLLGPMRADVFKTAREQGLKLTRGVEFVPDSTDIVDANYRAYIGKSVKKFVDDVLEPRFRNAVAHFIPDQGAVLHMSDPSQAEEYASVILVCELCVRVVIANHEALLNALHA